MTKNDKTRLENLLEVCKGAARYLRAMAKEEGNPNLSADNMIAHDLEKAVIAFAAREDYHSRGLNVETIANSSQQFPVSLLKTLINDDHIDLNSPISRNTLLDLVSKAENKTNQSVDLTDKIAEALWLQDKGNQYSVFYHNPFAGRTWEQMKQYSREEEELSGSIHNMIHRNTVIHYTSKAQGIDKLLSKPVSIKAVHKAAHGNLRLLMKDSYTEPFDNLLNTASECIAKAVLDAAGVPYVD